MGTENKFAKLFDSEKYGQILVLMTSGDLGEPAVELYFRPEGLGVCQMKLGFEDSDDGWDKADVAFERFELKPLEKYVKDFSEGLK
jgi:hypothetical protein